jgi:hypothetical protein
MFRIKMEVSNTSTNSIYMIGTLVALNIFQKYQGLVRCFIQNLGTHDLSHQKEQLGEVHSI